MPSDDHPVVALQHQFDLEDASTPVAAKLVKVGSSIPGLSAPLDKLFGWLKDRYVSDAQARLELVVDTLKTEHQKVADRVQQLSEVPAWQDAAKDLLLDAARKAVNTRAMERVKRIGLILAHGITESEAIDSDEIEEMMRVAMELSDKDVLYLRELVRIDGPAVENNGRITTFNALQAWEGGFWKITLTRTLTACLESSKVTASFPEFRRPTTRTLWPTFRIDMPC